MFEIYVSYTYESPRICEYSFGHIIGWACCVLILSACFLFVVVVFCCLFDAFCIHQHLYKRSFRACALNLKSGRSYINNDVVGSLFATERQTETVGSWRFPIFATR